MAEEKLTNIVTSSKPCPICAAINGMTMTLAEWEASPYGLPGSDGRYCDGSCHCILIPDSLLGKFDWIDPNFVPRGDPGSTVGPIVEIFPNEKALADLMNEWNLRFGRLPKEIYRMPVKDGWAYLKKLFDARVAGAPSTPPPPAAPIPVPPPPVPPPPAPIPAAPAAQPKPKRSKAASVGAKMTAAELKTARTKSVFAGEPDSFIRSQVETERKAWALNEKEKAGIGPAKGHGREHAFAVNADGTVTFFKRGKLGSVEYDWKEMYDSRNAVAWTHNHPTRNNVPNSFSGADAGFVAWGVDKHVVITAGKRYTMFKPAVGWYPGQAADVARLWQIYETQGAHSWDLNLQAAKINREVKRMKADHERIWLQHKPTEAKLDEVRASARAELKGTVDYKRSVYDRLQADPMSAEADRAAAWKDYSEWNAKMVKHGETARERYFYAQLDEAVREYMSKYNIRYTVEDWD